MVIKILIPVNKWLLSANQNLENMWRGTIFHIYLTMFILSFRCYLTKPTLQETCTILIGSPTTISRSQHVKPALLLLTKRQGIGNVSLKQEVLLLAGFPGKKFYNRFTKNYLLMKSIYIVRYNAKDTKKNRVYIHIKCQIVMYD